jgi:hypothetical protein
MAAKPFSENESEDKDGTWGKELKNTLLDTLPVILGGLKSES